MSCSAPPSTMGSRRRRIDAVEPKNVGMSVCAAPAKVPQASLLGDEHDPVALTLAAQVYIDYTNYRGERSVRLIQPLPDGLFFGSNKYHPEKQWLLRAVDVKKKALRTFALGSLHGWEVNADR